MKKKIKEKKQDNKEDLPKRSLLNINKFLHEPNRLQIIAQLYYTECVDLIYLKNILPLTWGNLSAHAIKLKEKGYISIEKQFIGKKPYTILQITQYGKEQFQKYKENMTKFLC